MCDIICITSKCCIFFFKQKPAYELRISDWSSDVCSSDLIESGASVMELVDQVAEHSGAALITITHDANVASLARRHYRLDRGVLAPVDVKRVLAMAADRKGVV